MELFNNNAAAELDGAINNSVTSLDVDDASDFPATGNFRIIIDDEIMKVTAVSSNTFTVVRGTEGTTAASHADLAAVTHVVTAASLRQLAQDYHLSGDYASLPAAGTAGRIYYPTDVPWVTHYRDNGSTWDVFRDGLLLTEPPASGWTWFNQGAATITTDRGSQLIESNDALSTFGGRRGRVRTLPATPFTIDMGFVITTTFDQYISLMARDSVGGDNHSFNIFLASGIAKLNVQQSTSPDAFSFENAVIPAHWSDVLFLRYTDNGTNKSFAVSQDGRIFYTVYTTTHTGWITANQIGFAAAISASVARLIHYKES